MPIKTLCIFGTRPETIKMAPVVHALNAHPGFDNYVCVTGQHREMLRLALDLFHIVPNYDLDVMTPNQSLSHLTSVMLLALDPVLITCKPDLVLVHGDTTTAMVGALAAFYHHIPVAHVEAGLRTHNIMRPWPEEANRHVAGVLTNVHFAPTQSARDNLLREGVSESAIHVTGNTVIDALFMMVERLESDSKVSHQYQQQFSFLRDDSKMVLITGHRRENFGEGFEQICEALRQLASTFPDVAFVYPVHLNPNVQKPVKAMLSNFANIHLIEPQEYLAFVYLMKRAYLILTDSGGVQEEAPSLGKPVLVMRDTTERPEAVSAGTVKLVSTYVETIVDEVTRLLTDKHAYHAMSVAQNPYGDGKAAARIVAVLAGKTQ